MRVIFFLILLCFSVASLTAQNNSGPASDAEKAFVRKLEQRIAPILVTAGKSMPGQWMMHINTDNRDQAAINIAQHNGRPHEFRYSLSMEYILTKAASATLQQELANHNKSMSKAAIIEGSRLNDPSLKYSIEVSVVINPYQFTPVDVQQFAAPGEITTEPGTALTLFRTKELGPGAPYYALYIGDYTLSNKNGKQLLEENFGKTTDCCNARTMVIEVHSSQTVANNFIGKLNLPALNRIIKEL